MSAPALLLALRFVPDATREAAARKTADRLAKRVQAAFSVTHGYGAGGFVIEGTVALGAPSWPERCVEAIAICQRVGRAWSITGDIRDEFEATTAEFRLPGVRWAWASMQRGEGG